MYDVKNKVVIITGAANGIGAYTVKYLLEQGAKHVAILDIAKNGDDFENEVTATFGAGRAKFYKCDVTDEEAVDKAFESIKQEFKDIDILINNAGIMNDSYQFYKKEIQINLTALVTCTLKALELMREDKGGKGGCIVNIASIVSLMPVPILPIYAATKSAVLQFSNSIGTDYYYSRTNVRVLTVCFGVTGTALLAVENVGNFGSRLNSEIVETILSYKVQKVESASAGVIEVIKKGESGSTWLVSNDKPAIDITEQVAKAYEILTSTFINL